MQNIYYENLRQGEEVRKNLIALRDSLREESARLEFRNSLAGEWSLLCGLLSSGDAKTRGAAARVIGLAGGAAQLESLLEAYAAEQTRYVRPEYLKGMQSIAERCTDGSHLPLPDEGSKEDVIQDALSEEKRLSAVQRLKERLQQLFSEPETPENRKHLREEQQELERLILLLSEDTKRKLTGREYRGSMVLVTNRLHREAAAEQLGVPIREGTAPDVPEESGKGYARLLRIGLQLTGVTLSDVLKVRCWNELMFPMGRIDGIRQEGRADAEQLAKLPLDERMGQLLSGGAPWRYRIDIRELAAGADNAGSSAGSRREQGRKKPADPEAAAGNTRERGNRLVQDLAMDFDRRKKGIWLNAPWEYEAELRLLERKDGSYLVMLVLPALATSRFSYRKEHIAASMGPANAALCMALARPWLKEHADVLDPFCGVGTMLIERAKLLPAGNLYGIDLFGEAVEKAKRNTARAGLSVHYINRDFFGFQHAYLFDEIVIDLPYVTPAKPKEEIAELYRRFFDTVGYLLKDGAVLVVYTSEPDLVRREIRHHLSFRVEKTFLMNEKNGTSLFVISYREQI